MTQVLLLACCQQLVCMIEMQVCCLRGNPEIRAYHFGQAINKCHGVFTRDDVKLMKTLCDQTGIMLYHSHLLKTMQKQSSARFDLCQYAVKVLECRDDEAISHLVAIHGAKVQIF